MTTHITKENLFKVSLKGKEKKKTSNHQITLYHTEELRNKFGKKSSSESISGKIFIKQLDYKSFLTGLRKKCVWSLVNPGEINFFRAL